MSRQKDTYPVRYIHEQKSDFNNHSNNLKFVQLIVGTENCKKRKIIITIYKTGFKKIKKWNNVIFL